MKLALPQRRDHPCLARGIIGYYVLGLVGLWLRGTTAERLRLKIFLVFRILRHGIRAKISPDRFFKFKLKQPPHHRRQARKPPDHLKVSALNRKPRGISRAYWVQEVY